MTHRPIIGISMNYMQLGSFMQYHVRDKYINAIRDHGGMPLPIPCTDDRELLIQYYDLVDAILIIGGMDYPPSLYNEEIDPHSEVMEELRAHSDMLMVELAIQTQKPLLGICAGMQLLNIYFGGKLIQHIPNLELHYGEKYHHIKIIDGIHLRKLFGEQDQRVVSNHHQGIDPKHIGAGLIVCAYSEDGSIEALEHRDYPNILGIQWHPERMDDLAHRKKIFDYLISGFAR